jgi:diadenosine tetraphosphate (Ap4A) HIT family hydrolase
VIPKVHGEKLTDIPDDHLTEILVCENQSIDTLIRKGLDLTRCFPPQPIAKKLVIATGAQEYNILQNNGKGAHQEVGHVSGLCP